MEGYLSKPRERGRRQTQPTPRNKFTRLDHQKRKEEGEIASRDRGIMAYLGKGVDRGDDDFS